MDDAAGDQVKFIDFLADRHRMAGIITAIHAGNQIGYIRE